MSLTKLDASYNHLQALPSSMGRLTNLTSLMLIENPIKSLPPDLKRLTNIVELRVKITEVRRGLRRSVDQAWT